MTQPKLRPRASSPKSTAISTVISTVTSTDRSTIDRRGPSVPEGARASLRTVAVVLGVLLAILGALLLFTREREPALLVFDGAPGETMLAARWDDGRTEESPAPRVPLRRTMHRVRIANADSSKPLPVYIHEIATEERVLDLSPLGAQPGATFNRILSIDSPAGVELEASFMSLHLLLGAGPEEQRIRVTVDGEPQVVALKTSSVNRIVIDDVPRTASPRSAVFSVPSENVRRVTISSTDSPLASRPATLVLRDKRIVVPPLDTSPGVEPGSLVFDLSGLRPAKAPDRVVLLFAAVTLLTTTIVLTAARGRGFPRAVGFLVFTLLSFLAYANCLRKEDAELVLEGESASGIAGGVQLGTGAHAFRRSVPLYSSQPLAKGKHTVRIRPYTGPLLDTLYIHSIRTDSGELPLDSLPEGPYVYRDRGAFVLKAGRPFDFTTELSSLALTVGVGKDIERVAVTLDEDERIFELSHDRLNTLTIDDRFAGASFNVRLPVRGTGLDELRIVPSGATRIASIRVVAGDKEVVLPAPAVVSSSPVTFSGIGLLLGRLNQPLLVAELILAALLGWIACMLAGIPRAMGARSWREALPRIISERRYLRVASTVGLIVLCLVTAELSVRFARTFSAGMRLFTLYRYAGQNDFQAISNLEDLMANSPQRYPAYINHLGFILNSMGFKAPKYTVEKPPGSYRIVALGDSFTFGSVWFHELFTKKIADALEAGLGQKTEMLNLGVSGTGPFFQLRLLELEVLRLKPDAIVWNFYVGNDLDDGREYKILTARERLLSSCYSCRLVRNIYLLLDSEMGRTATDVPWWRRPITDSHAREHAGEATPGVEGDFPFRPERAGMDPETYASLVGLKLEWFSEETVDREHFAKVADALVRAKRLCDQAGIRLVVALLPDELQIDESLRHAGEAKRREWKKPLGTVDVELPQKMLRHVFEQSGIEYVDLLDAFRAESAKRPLFLIRDTHWNAAGNEVAADVIGSKLLADSH